MNNKIDETGCISGKNVIRTRSGLWFDLTNPQPDQITLTDIANALSKLCRYGGQIENFYSVAEHSVLCAMQARQDGYSIDVQRAALMHDAAEAYCGDIIRTLKRMLGDYEPIESRILHAIGSKYKIPFSAAWGQVKEIDNAMLAAEVALFYPDGITSFGLEHIRHIDPPIVGWWPNNAAWHFLDCAKSLGITDERNVFDESRNDTVNASSITGVAYRPGVKHEPQIAEHAIILYRGNSQRR